MSHHIDKLHPNPIADGLADEHGDGDYVNIRTEEAKGDGNEITNTGEENEEADPRAFPLDPVLYLP